MTYFWDHTVNSKKRECTCSSYQYRSQHSSSEGSGEFGTCSVDGN